jgi:hypothetical protein
VGRYQDYRERNALTWRQVIWGVVLWGGLYTAMAETAGYGVLVGAACWLVVLLLLGVLGRWAWRERQHPTRDDASSVEIDRSSVWLRVVLGAGILLTLAAQATVFAGGGAGGMVTVAMFYVFATAFLIAAVRYLGKGSKAREKARWGWALAAVLAFAFGIPLSDTWIASVLVSVVLVCALALIVLWLQTLCRGVRSLLG